MKLFSFILFLALLVPSISNAQGCRSFTKKTCRPALENYIHNGQMNTAVLYPGDKADMMLTFYSGQKYRLLVCSQEQLGDVTFRILDVDRNEVYNSEAKNSNIFDFKVASTQQLIVEITVPKGNNTHDMDFQGCISILVGFTE
jgi:hypothetical protein